MNLISSLIVFLFLVIAVLGALTMAMIIELIIEIRKNDKK